MNKKSAGILLYRFNNGVLQVLLVHPGGPYWANKDEGVWSVPKGEPHGEEELLKAALREFNEETGITVDAKGFFTELTPLKQKSGKMVYVWAHKGDAAVGNIVSNIIKIEWPPRSGKMIEIPEVDKAAWLNLEEARLKIVPGQKGFIDELEDMLM